MQAERVNISLQHTQDMSMQGDMNSNTVNTIKPISRSSPNRDKPVTIASLRASDYIKKCTAEPQARLQRVADEDLTIGEQFFKTVKSGRERIGGSDHKLAYIKWPQEAVFIVPVRKRVRYDELSQSQWTAGLTAIAAEEPNSTVQKHMFTYLASLLQDVCDYCCQSRCGAHDLVCSYFGRR